MIPYETFLMPYSLRSLPMLLSSFISTAIAVEPPQEPGDMHALFRNFAYSIYYDLVIAVVDTERKVISNRR